MKDIKEMMDKIALRAQIVLTLCRMFIPAIPYI